MDKTIKLQELIIYQLKFVASRMLKHPGNIPCCGEVLIALSTNSDMKILDGQEKTLGMVIKKGIG